MPVLLAPIIAGAGLTGGISLFGGATIGEFAISYASIAAYGLTGAALLGASVLANSLAGQQHVNAKLNYKQATPARLRCYGYCKLGGAFYVIATVNGTLLQGFVHCQGPLDAIVEWWLNDVQATGIAAGALSGNSGQIPGKEKLLLDSQLGHADQATNPGVAVLLPTWGPSRRLAGLANTAMRCELPSDAAKNFQKYYPGGVPAVRVVARTSLVYDPREPGQSPADNPYAPATWTFSQNAGLAVLDYLTHPDGAALKRSLFDMASFSAFADVCDQLVNLADGTNELRYIVLQGTYDFTETKADVLKRLLATCDGELYQLANGTIGIRGGVWEDPTVTIDDSMVTAYSVQQGAGKLATFNQYRIRYIDLNLDYQQVEGDPWDDTAAQAASGTVVSQDFDARCSPYNQARRLAKIAMAKANPDWIVELTCTMAALDAFGERVVNLVLYDLGIAGTFYVSKFELSGDLAGSTMTLTSLAAEAYQWDTTQEGHPAPNTYLDAPETVIPDVVGLSLSLMRTSVTGGINAAQIQAVVDAPADTSVGLHAQYRLEGTTAWSDMSSNGTWSALSGIVSDGATYEVQAAFETFGGTDGTFVSDTIEVQADSTAPDAPTTIDAALSGASVDVSCMNPDSANYYATRFYRGATFAGATLLGTVYGNRDAEADLSDDPAPSGTNLYWVTAINHSGVASDPAGPARVTV